MKRLAMAIVLLAAAAAALGQSCTTGGGVTCTPNLNMWVIPLNYANWNVPVNDNTSLLDAFAGTVVLKAGSTMTGPLILSADPTTNLGAATKQYVDGKVGGVTSFSAPAASWPTWLVPTVATSTTTPTLTVAASAIPNSALLNSTLTLGSTTLTLGVTTTAVNGLTIDGVSPATMAFVDATSSIQTQLNGKAAKGANTDITSLSGLTTPLSVSQGGTGVATGTGYAYGNGTGAFTFSTTIPYSAITGAPATGVSSVFGRTGAVVAQSGDYTVSQINGAAPLTNPTFFGTVTGSAFAGTQLSSPLAPLGTPTTGTGTLAAGTYYAKIVAVDGNGFTTAGGAESAAVTLSSTGEIAWSWSTTTSAASYQLWVGTSAGAENTFVAVSGTSYTQTAALTSGTIPATNSTGSLLLAGTGKAATFNVTGQYQVNGTQIAASNLSNGVTGTGSIVLAASPALTGTPTAPTAATNTNTTQVSTTAYVLANTTSIYQCGTTSTCSNTLLPRPYYVYQGSVTLAAGTATVTGLSPGFTGTTNAQCSCEDITTPLQACAAVLASSTSVTVTGNTTDVNKYRCEGN